MTSARKVALFIGIPAAVALFTSLLARHAATVAEEAYSSNVQIEVRRAPTDFLPDGDLAKALWKQANVVEFDHDASGKVHHQELATRVAALWSEKYIYFAFWSHYDALNMYEGEDPAKERWKLWERDVAEVFLNPDPARVPHYFEFEVAPNNQWIDLEIDKTKDPFNDASWNSGFEHATRIDAASHTWTAEMRIPLSSMHVTDVRPGVEWRGNFFRAAGKGNDAERKFLAWSIIPEGKTFHVPTRFGILRLVK